VLQQRVMVKMASPPVLPENMPHALPLQKEPALPLLVAGNTGMERAAAAPGLVRSGGR
jgi:hypothetical protein